MLGKTLSYFLGTTPPNTHTTNDSALESGHREYFDAGYTFGSRMQGFEERLNGFEMRLQPIENFFSSASKWLLRVSLFSCLLLAIWIVYDKYPEIKRIVSHEPVAASTK